MSNANKPTGSGDSAQVDEQAAEMSVVIPSVNGLGDLVGCLEALAHEQGDRRLEVIVVDRLGESVRSVVRQQFPWVRIIEVPGETSIPEMRAHGIWASVGEVVAVIEDHVLVRRGWVGQMLGAIAEGAEVVGGAIENAATDTTSDWAAFLCEYSHCLSPLQGGEVEWLVGNNVAYRRELLERHRAAIDEHKWEGHLHDAIRGSGGTLVCDPTIVVDHKKHFTPREYVSLRYLYSRSYAGARGEAFGPLMRVIAGFAALALPPVLLTRIVRRILQKRRHRDWLLRSLPLFPVFVCAWAWGEAVGYWWGAGDSLSRVT